MIKVVIKRNNKNPFVAYEGRKDRMGIITSLYADCDDLPYEVVVSEAEKEVFRGPYHKAISWVKTL